MPVAQSSDLSSSLHPLSVGTRRVPPSSAASVDSVIWIPASLLIFPVRLACSLAVLLSRARPTYSATTLRLPFTVTLALNAP
jgi:hypothetical protein